MFCDGKYIPENLSSLSDGELSTLAGHPVKCSVMCVKTRTSLIKIYGQRIEIHSNAVWHHSVQIATAFELHSNSST